MTGAITQPGTAPLRKAFRPQQTELYDESLLARGAVISWLCCWVGCEATCWQHAGNTQVYACSGVILFRVTGATGRRAGDSSDLCKAGECGRQAGGALRAQRGGSGLPLDGRLSVSRRHDACQHRTCPVFCLLRGLLSGSASVPASNLSSCSKSGDEPGATRLVVLWNRLACRPRFVGACRLCASPVRKAIMPDCPHSHHLGCVCKCVEHCLRVHRCKVHRCTHQSLRAVMSLLPQCPVHVKVPHPLSRSR